jgi:hypothetical protein
LVKSLLAESFVPATNFDRFCTFELKAFTEPRVPLNRITGSLGHKGSWFSLALKLFGAVDQILLPTGSVVPGRGGDLWKATCFEVFFRTSGESRYWELNLSPTGQWEFYCFSSYREGRVLADGVVFEGIKSTKVEESWEVTSDWNIDFLKTHSGPMLLGVSVVIQDIQGQYDYWATHHPGDKPDFHDPRGFVLSL